MTLYSAVIGMHYGDEGKGLIVDWLSNDRTLVVRANGGAQAGHTVVLPNGTRHVFSHFGAGYFQGADTYLGPHFFVNPLLYKKEDHRLRNKLSVEKRPRIYLNGRSPVVTPFDMMINQKLERKRGAVKHGSCGVGIFETWNRHKHPCGVRLSVADLFGHREILKDKLHQIRVEWTAGRLQELGLKNDMDLDFQPFLQDVDYLMRTAEIACWGDALPAIRYDQVVFEGAQGLMLDMDNRDMFPHLTPSKTGLRNILDLLPGSRLDPMYVYYVSRSYVTRHGHGPLPHESMPLNPRILDETNLTNEFQGTIRTAPIDLDLMKQALQKDIHEANSRVANCVYSLVFTHLDAFPLSEKNDILLDIVEGGELKKKSVTWIVAKLEESCRYLVRSIYGSKGPTRDHVFKYGTGRSWR